MNLSKFTKSLKKKAHSTAQKYKHIRRTLQKKADYRTVKLIKSRESRIIRNMNHQISKKIVDIAVDTNSHIKMENLKGIRQGKKHSKKFNYALNSWSFYQLRDMIGYKAKKQGVGVFFIDPAYTSQTCSRCGVLGNRNSKIFKCPICGHADHADANASFNIGQWTKRLGLLQTDSDVCKGNTDIPRMLLV